MAGLEVRLALLVLHQYARDRKLVRGFWERASADDRTVSEGLQEPLHALRKRLEELGWLAPDVQLNRVSYWPWNTPTPPGWRRVPRASQDDELG